MADASDPDTRLLLAHCEEGVLLPFVGARDSRSITAAEAAARSHLVQADFIDPGAAASACRALAAGVAAWAGAGQTEEPDRGEEPDPRTEAVPTTVAAPAEEGVERAKDADGTPSEGPDASHAAPGGAVEPEPADPKARPLVTRRRALLLAGGVGLAALAAVGLHAM